MKLGKDIRLAVWGKTNGRCWYCGCELEESLQGGRNLNGFCVDHSIPLSKGGTDDLENLLPACKTCNTLKRNDSIERLRRYLSERNGVVFFSEAQTEYLASLGVNLPEPELYVFYFERLGLNSDKAPA